MHWLRPGLVVHVPPGVHEGRQVLPLHVKPLLQALPQQGWLLAPHARQVPLSQIWPLPQVGPPVFTQLRLPLASQA
jgi:hypothetical protein